MLGHEHAKKEQCPSWTPVWPRHHNHTDVDQRPGFGWTMLRHVATERQDLVWRESVRRLRLHFPCDPVLIIDNRSNRTIHPVPNGARLSPQRKGQPDVPLFPCDAGEFASVTHDGLCWVAAWDQSPAGEYLPFHLMHRLRPFERTAFIFDSALPLPHPRSPVFDPKSTAHAMYQEAVREGRRAAASVRGFRGLWDFSSAIALKEEPSQGRPLGLEHTIHELIYRLQAKSNSTALMERLAELPRWAGIFGANAAFDLQFADMLEHDLGLSSAMTIVSTAPNRHGRKAWERVVGIIASFGGGSPLAAERAAGGPCRKLQAFSSKEVDGKGRTLVDGWTCPERKTPLAAQMPSAIQGAIQGAQTKGLTMDLSCEDLLAGLAVPLRNTTFLLKCWMGR